MLMRPGRHEWLVDHTHETCTICGIDRPLGSLDEQPPCSPVLLPDLVPQVAP
jgi:hypothetical protein